MLCNVLSVVILSLLLHFTHNNHSVLMRGIFNCLERIDIKSECELDQIMLALEGKVSNRALLSISIVSFYSHQSLCINEGGYYQGGVVVWRGLNSWQVIFGQIIYDYDDNIQTCLKHTNTMKHHNSIYSISAKIETCSHSKFH